MVARHQSLAGLVLAPCPSLQRRPSGADTMFTGGNDLDRQAVSIIRAAQLVGVSRRTIYNWLAAGKLEYVRTAGGSVRIFVDSLWRDPAAPRRPATETTTGAAPRGEDYL